jgi:hypothetical protein
MERALSIELVQRNFDKESPEVSASFQGKGALSCPYEKAPISGHDDIVGIKPC